MAKQTNTPEDWRILAERDMVVADHLAVTIGFTIFALFLFLLLFIISIFV